VSPVRLPWPFGRRTPSDGRSSREPEDADGASPVDPAPSNPANPAGPAIAPATGAWATLPPIQRTVSAAPLVAPSAPFLADVPGHRPLPPIVQPLGHETGAATPSGLVVARVSTVPALTSQAPMPTRGAQRRTASSAAAGDNVGAAYDVTEPAATATTVSAGTPIRQLATVAPGATITPSARPLTRSPEPVTVAQRSMGPARVSSASATSSGSPAAAPLSTTGQPTTLDRRHTPPPRGAGPGRGASRWAESPAAPLGTTPTPVGLGAPLASGPGQASLAGADDAGSASWAAAAQPPLSAASRRAGLGAPIAVQPASAVAQPRPASRLPLLTGPTREGSAATADHLPSASAEADVARHGAPAQTRPLPVLPVSRQRTGQPVRQSRVPAAPAASVASTAAAGVTPTGSGTAFRPTMGIRPIQTGVATQREAAAAVSATGDTPSVPARWASGDDLPMVVRSVAPSVGLPLEADLVPLEPLADIPTAPVSTAPPRAMPREAVFPPRGAAITMPQGSASSVAGGPWTAGVQRQPAPGAPSGFGSPSSASTASPDSLGRTPPTPGPTLREALTLARPQGTAPHAASSPSAPVVSRIVAGEASGASRPTVQASGAGSGGAATGGITATPVVQRVDGAAPAAPSDEGHSESELDELARALFGRIRTHLRAEVIHEREARGHTFDAF